MLHIKNLKRDAPKNEEQAHLVEAYNVVLLFDEDGAYWYDMIPKFSPNTYKILYDADGNILQIEKDASHLSPMDNTSVLEVANRKEAKNLHNKLYSLEKDIVCWKVIDGCVVFSPSNKDIKFLKAEELTWVKNKVEVYKSRELLGLLSTEEEECLNALLGYAKEVDKCLSGDDLQALSRPILPE